MGMRCHGYSLSCLGIVSITRRQVERCACLLMGIDWLWTEQLQTTRCGFPHMFIHGMVGGPRGGVVAMPCRSNRGA